MTTLYEKPIRLLLIEMFDELLPGGADEMTFQDALDWFETKYPGFNDKTVRAHLYRFSTNAHCRLSYGAKKDGSEDIIFQVAASRYRRYNPQLDPPPIHLADSDLIEEDADDLVETIVAVDNKFAYEQNLRDYLARNMHLIEQGLTLHGVEYPAGGRRIDLLGIDRNGGYVVVELKVSKGHDRVIGQLFHYMGWVKKHLAEGRPVRGVIIASEITEDLRLAHYGNPDVRLIEYTMAVELQDVTKEMV